MAKLPWEHTPPYPQLDLNKAQEQGLLTLPHGIQIWHAIFGVPLKETLAAGTLRVVLLTGGISHSGHYGYQVDHLSPKHTVICFDHRGHGRTPLGDDTWITYDKLTTDLLALLDVYQIPKAALVSRVDRIFAFGGIDDCDKNEGDAIDELDSLKEYFNMSQKEWLKLNPGQDDNNNFMPYYKLWKREPKWTSETFKDVPVRGEDNELL
ncbi:hypothetical protein EDD37DRAFT_682194 [Exophiala viscosa]|uniref:uncharacterized protein n=1 Tax=Exophiala viscosa TaxID=2486360 RepID=UPI00219FD138|nr:hypothetical protein EDD37DRAFT_682194 [Exophiala viscosa]